ncbi:hypothetical protein [Streptomyces chartreusis]|uniref:hypothetical protein n=1 Tax=Streptomyces chartreusis TaxID=1969 RepID=UPI0038110E2D
MLKTFKRWHIITAALVLVAGLAVTGWLIVRPTYDETVNTCIAALKDRTEGDKAKPDACDGVKEDDYTLIEMHQILDKQGVWNDDGSVNMEQLLDPDGQP